MPVSGGIDSLCEKLHAWHGCVEEMGKTLATKIIYWGKNGCREPRCVEEEENVRREEEMNGKKSKEKEKEKREAENGKVTRDMFLKREIAAHTERILLFKRSSILTRVFEERSTTLNYYRPSASTAAAGVTQKKLAAISEENRGAIGEWAKAEACLEGDKIHDDESRLKAVEEQVEKRQWKVTAAMAAGQKKRNDNIAMRNERKNDKKKGLSKKARLRRKILWEG
ncbi:hypothetical protein BYT27DRAFT_7261407 [Phlegmacium glaucopus]|nr:hypothetical protein BYT27DRAFT_7261407 [Phlegmacium glaucopus]